MAEIAALLVTALLFGGMCLYSFGFAAFLFSALPADVAGATLRRAFPHFYSFVIAAACAGAVLVWPFDRLGAALLALVAASTVPARQVLMPAINRATDTGAAGRFRWLHGASVAFTLTHICLPPWCLRGPPSLRAGLFAALGGGKPAQCAPRPCLRVGAGHPLRRLEDARRRPSSRFRDRAPASLPWSGTR